MSAFSSLQVPLNLRCHPHNVVLAVTLPHNEKVAPLGLEKLVRTGNDNDTRKVGLFNFLQKKIPG